MDPKGAQHYLRTKVLTATAEQLQLLLFDGAIRFVEQGKLALQNKNFEQSCRALNKAQAIVNQLISGLRPDVAPDLCHKLKGLYVFAYKKLVDANLNHHLESLQMALDVLTFQRQTWTMLMQNLAKQKAGLAAARIDLPAPNAKMEASISMCG